MKPLHAAVLALGVAMIGLAGVAGLAWLTLHRSPAAAPGSARIERIVADYLRRHPEALVAALQDYQDRQQAKQADQARAAIAASRNELLHDPMSPVGANPTGDVTIVEFFDYQCPYCKAVAPDLAKALAADGRLRLVYKEFPILGPASMTAAKAALASVAQGKYAAFHDKLIGFKGQLDDATIFSLAADIGIDVPRLKVDMEKPAITEAIERNYRLADKLAIQGTPAFVIGGELLSGAASLQDLADAVKRARKG